MFWYLNGKPLVNQKTLLTKIVYVPKGSRWVYCIADTEGRKSILKHNIFKLIFIRTNSALMEYSYHLITQLL